MAATERMMGSLQQSRSAMGSSAILSFKAPFHPSYGFGRSYRKWIPSVQASRAGKEECSATTLSKLHEESSSSRSASGVSSLLKAVQISGSSAVLQQVSSIRHFFTPELPQALIREIKRRMALPFKDQDDNEESPIQDDLNGGLLKEDLAEERVPLLGPRCAWPRSKLASTEGERREEANQEGPRCAWPRAAAAHTLSASSSVQQWKQKERASSITGEGASSGAKCAWPRATSRNTNYQNNTHRGLVSSKSPLEGSQEVDVSKSSHEDRLVNSLSSLEDLQNGAIAKGSQESLEKEALSKRVQECIKEEPVTDVNNSVNEGPRCAWPRSTPRRMLATGVGLSLMNYLLIGQGSPALAILLETPLSFTCEEEPCVSSPLQSLLP